MALLRVRKGASPGAVHPVHDSVKPTLIGRDAAADVPLDDDRTSRKHARILRAWGSWFVHDLGSSNGTIVNGERAEKSRIGEGTRIQIGGTLMTFHPDEFVPPPTDEVFGSRLLSVVTEEGGIFVFRAFQSAMDREVRVDRLEPRRGLPSRVLERAEQAFAEALKVHHPGLDALLHSSVSAPARCYTVLRCRPGQTLAESLETLVASPLRARIAFLRTLVDVWLARAVWESLRSPIGLHQISVTSDDSGQPVATMPAVELRALVSERTGGTLHLPAYAPYLAPELTSPDGLPDTVDFSSVMYGLGAVSYHVLTGRPPMGTGPVRKLLEAHRQLTPAPAHLVCPEIPEGLSTILAGLLEKEPFRRPAGRMEIVSALDAAEAQLPAAPAPGRAPSAPRPRGAPESGVSRAPERRSARQARRVGFFGRSASAPIWIALWIGLFFGLREVVKLLLLTRT